MTAYAPKSESVETSLVIQGQRLCSSNAGGMGLIPGQGTNPFPGKGKNSYFFFGCAAQHFGS